MGKISRSDNTITVTFDNLEELLSKPTWVWFSKESFQDTWVYDTVRKIIYRAAALLVKTKAPDTIEHWHGIKIEGGPITVTIEKNTEKK